MQSFWSHHVLSILEYLYFERRVLFFRAPSVNNLLSWNWLISTLKPIEGGNLGIYLLSYKRHSVICDVSVTFYLLILHISLRVRGVHVCSTTKVITSAMVSFKWLCRCVIFCCLFRCRRSFTITLRMQQSFLTDKDDIWGPPLYP